MNPSRYISLCYGLFIRRDSLGQERFSVPLVLSFICCLLALLLSSRPAVSQENTSLALPAGGGVIDEWFSHLPINAMTGAKVTAAAVEPARSPWLYSFFPVLQRAKIVPVGGMNPEAMILLHPRLVILPAERQGKAEILRNAGLHVEVLDFVDYAGLLACVKKSAALENTPIALKRAALYEKFLIENLGQNPINMETAACRPNSGHPHPVPEKLSGPKVLHLSSLHPLKADGRHTVIDEWIRTAGGQNVFTFDGNKKEITWEQVYAWNPDIIILEANAGKWEKGSVPEGAFLLKAFKKKHLYRNPAGLFLWDRSGPELALQVLWAKAIIAGTDLDMIEMKKKMRFFYQSFYGLNPSNEVLEKILKGEAPS